MPKPKRIPHARPGERQPYPPPGLTLHFLDEGHRRDYELTRTGLMLSDIIHSISPLALAGLATACQTATETFQRSGAGSVLALNPLTPEAKQEATTSYHQALRTALRDCLAGKGHADT